MLEKAVFSEITHSSEETRELARTIMLQWSLPVVVALAGELGAGKTVFVQGLARALGVTQIVNSPTFTLINEYAYPGGMMFHADLYRLNSLAEVVALGLDDYFQRFYSIFVIEWALKFPTILPKNYIQVQLTLLNETDRKINGYVVTRH